MTNNITNAKRADILDALRKHLKKDTNNPFRLDLYVETPKDDSDHYDMKIDVVDNSLSCGASCCILGRLPLIPEAKELVEMYKKKGRYDFTRMGEMLCPDGADNSLFYDDYDLKGKALFDFKIQQLEEQSEIYRG